VEYITINILAFFSPVASILMSPSERRLDKKRVANFDNKCMSSENVFCSRTCNAFLTCYFLSIFVSALCKRKHSRNCYWGCCILATFFLFHVPTEICSGCCFFETSAIALKL